LASYVDQNKKVKMEFNFGREEDGFTCFEYNSAEELLQNAKIDGKTLEELWDELK